MEEVVVTTGIEAMTEIEAMTGMGAVTGMETGISREHRTTGHMRLI